QAQKLVANSHLEPARIAGEVLGHGLRLAAFDALCGQEKCTSIKDVVVLRRKTARLAQPFAEPHEAGLAEQMGPMPQTLLGVLRDERLAFVQTAKGEFWVCLVNARLVGCRNCAVDLRDLGQDVPGLLRDAAITLALRPGVCSLPIIRREIE